MKIMVSACLAGENCKYNGGNNRNESECDCKGNGGGLCFPELLS